MSGSFPVKNITDLRDYVPFKGHNPHQVYRVNFDDNGNTEIFIDKYSGDVVEELITGAGLHSLLLTYMTLTFSI